MRHEHISGLAARDATDPQLMTAGFFALGACTVTFASALERRLGPRAGCRSRPDRVAGLATIAAGLFRRDRAVELPTARRAGWSIVGERRARPRRRDGWRSRNSRAGRRSRRRWRGNRKLGIWRDTRSERPARAPEISAWFLRDVVRPGNGLLQRANVTIPLVFMVRLAIRLMKDARE